MKRAVFLDLEGPIVTHRSIIAGNAIVGEEYSGDRSFQWIKYADLTALSMVSVLCKNFDAHLVITSMLRSSDRIMGQIYAFLIENDLDPKVYAKTIHDRSSKREREIEAYIAENKITQFVVIDDKNLSIKNFVQVDSRDGFNYSCYQDAKGFLFDPETDKEDLIRQEAIYI